MKEKFLSLFDAKLWKFILVGLLNTLVGNGLSFLLLNLVGWQALGLERWNVEISAGISTVIASIMSYFLNRYFTFRYQGGHVKVILRFALNIALCYLLAYGIGQRVVAWMLSGMGDRMRDNLAMVAGMCLFVGFNYLGQRFFAFKED